VTANERFKPLAIQLADVHQRWRVFEMKFIWMALPALVACTTPASDVTDSSRTSPETSARPSSTSSAARRPQPSAPSADLPVTADTSQEIYIDSVTPGNPLRVSGRARTFENTVQIRVRNAAGDVIAEEFTTSVGEMGRRNPYAAQAWIVRDPGARVTVEAFEYSAKDGSERSLTKVVVPFDTERSRVTLMLPVGGDCTETRAFTRVVPTSVALARLVVEALVAGADSAEKAAGVASPFPPGSSVNSVTLRGSTLTVDFNERLRNVGGSCAARAIRQSVTQTLERLPTVKKVVITAAGSERLALQP
jgi:hypothetical protein